MVLYSVPALILLWQVEPEMTSGALCARDPRLQETVPATELAEGNFRNVAKWVFASTKLFIGTAEEDVLRAKNCFIFGKVRAGDLMEAYSRLYRLRWIRYSKGRPTYELAYAKDQLDGIYAPQAELQKQRFDATRAFLNLFDKLAPQDRARVLAGQSLDYSKMSRKMQDAFTKIINIQIEAHLASLPANTLKPDIDPLTRAEIRIRDESKPNTGIRELWFESDTNLGTFSFRWNDYDRTKNYYSSARPVAMIHEAMPNERFSRKAMIAKSGKLRTLVTIQQGEGSLAELLKRLSADFGLNFIIEEDTEKRILPFACENIPLWEALDKISEIYGDWEWELGPGDFVILRSKQSPRRRDLGTP